jgi:glycosyltransferase involved in cell wall biosynthesis
MFISLLRLRLRNSILRALIPAFDRWLPTKPMRAHDRLNILLINWRDPKHPKAGGAEQYCYHVARSLVEAGHHVEWLTAGFPGAARHEVLDGIQVTRVGNSVTVYALAAVEYLRAMRDRFHVIIDSENGIPFFTPLFSLKPKVLLVYHVHRDVFLSQLPFPLSRLLVFIELKLVPLLYRNASIVTISASTKRDLERYDKTRLPIEIVEPGISGEFAAGERAKDPTVLYVGRIEPYKRLDLLIQAFATVLSDLPNARLRIAGTGSDVDRLRRVAAHAGIAERVRFLGRVTEDQKATELMSAWVFVNPSSMEGWGISILEAAACATPAVAFDVPGLSESIVPGVTGSLVRVLKDTDLVRDLAGAMATYLQAPELCRDHGKNAAERARDYSWSKQAAKFREILIGRALNMPYNLIRKDGEWYLAAKGFRGDLRSLHDASGGFGVDDVRTDSMPAPQPLVSPNSR